MCKHLHLFWSFEVFLVGRDVPYGMCVFSFAYTSGNVVKILMLHNGTSYIDGSRNCIMFVNVLLC